MMLLRTYLVLREIVRKIGHHDLGLGWDTVGRRTTLTTLTRLTRVGVGTLLVGLLTLLTLLCLLGLLGLVLVGCLSQGEDVLVGRSLCTFCALRLETVSFFMICWGAHKAYATTSTSCTSSASTATSTATGVSATATFTSGTSLTS